MIEAREAVEIGAPRALRGLVEYTLPNGLRVVLAPDPGDPVVGVTVCYDVGSRAEPDGHAGLAHLFEHLMFQGSRNVGRLEHFRYVQGAGGTANGSTHLDHTEFYEEVPPNALERVLFLEADRMRSPLITEASLRNQVDVVAGEIRANVLSRPYGGFPAVAVPAVLFTNFANTHDTYGSIEGLRALSLAEARAFFDRHYAPGNAVLAVTGDVDTAATERAVAAHFGGIPARPVPEPADLAEPWPDADRHGIHVDELAPLPAFALAWRTPDPVGRLADHLPYVVLSEVLAGGASSRLVRRLMTEEGLVSEIGARTGATNEPFTVRDPTCLILTGVLPERGDAAAAIRAVDEELDRLAVDGPGPDEVACATAHLAANVLARLDRASDRARALAAIAQRHGGAAVAGDIARQAARVTGAQVAAAAAALREGHRAVVELVPGSRR